MNKTFEQVEKDLVKLIFYNSLSVQEIKTILYLLDIKTKNEVLQILKVEATKEFYNAVISNE